MCDVWYTWWPLGVCRPKNFHVMNIFVAFGREASVVEDDAWSWGVVMALAGAGIGSDAWFEDDSLLCLRVPNFGG